MELKICGVTDRNTLNKLDALGVDYAGLWFNVPKGKYTLSKHKFSALTLATTKKLKIIGVTTDSNENNIIKFIANANIFGLQLQGFQTPKFVSTLKQRLKSSIEIAKVLHVKDNQCLEQRYIKSYKDAGVDFFILDTFISSSQIGSTGVSFSLDAMESVLAEIGLENTFLAGGFDSTSITGLHEYKGLRGVDVDSAARDRGQISESAVNRLVSSAKAMERSKANG